MVDGTVVRTSLYVVTKRQDIIDATKTLLWEHGYQATSPRRIQELSNAGQGCFYHHFKSKKELVAKTLEEVCDERIAEFDRVFGDSGPVIDRIESYLRRPREARKGCRIGRMAWDSAINEVELRRPLERYFQHVESRMLSALEEAAAAGQLSATVPLENIVALAIGGLQGAFTMRRVMEDPGWYARCIDSILMSIRCALREGI